jgi:hypothetical protein
MKSVFSYFRGSFVVTFLGLALAAWIGWQSGGQAGMLSFLLLGAILAVLEISLSFDNAIVNANKLKTMTPLWQKRFLTWGIIIAVFGMRIIFPILVVVIAAKIGPIEAIKLAATEPAEYARIMDEAHLGIAGFGGAFLMMVALNFFIDHDKEVHWIGALERRFISLPGVTHLATGIVCLVILLISQIIPAEDVATFFVASLSGLVTYIAVECLGEVLDAEADVTKGAAAGGLGAFLYLEMLDASFSFDGVIGAFALTQNMFLIAIGLGIGAMYVRSMTIMLVEKGTLSEFRYLEHGAFWSILVLSIIMFIQVEYHIPEVITGLFGATLIIAALVSSIMWRRNNVEEEPAVSLEPGNVVMPASAEQAAAGQ